MRVLHAVLQGPVCMYACGNAKQVSTNLVCSTHTRSMHPIFDLLMVGLASKKTYAI